MDETRDANGTKLADGDAVTPIRNTRLTGDPDAIACNAETGKGLVLKAQCLERA